MAFPLATGAAASLVVLAIYIATSKLLAWHIRRRECLRWAARLRADHRARDTDSLNGVLPRTGEDPPAWVVGDDENGRKAAGDELIA